jgi:hypothetical protein
MQLTNLAKRFIASSPLVSPLAIDATCGNGHDTVFLARLVGDAGHVYAFDTQAMAIDSSQQYLDTEHLGNRASLYEISHADILKVLPKFCIGNIGASMFNLGYLPGSDHLQTTQPISTVSALKTCCDLLCIGGKMSVLCYPGHSTGTEETQAVLKWFKSLDSKRFDCTEPIRSQNPKSPILLCLTRW